MARKREGQEVLRHLATTIQELQNLDLKELRQSFGLSQDRAAQLVGVPVRTWTRWEHRKMSPRISAWKEIIEAFQSLLPQSS